MSACPSSAGVMRSAPDAAAEAHTRRVQEAVVAAIESAGGWISFAEYMQQRAPK